MNQQLDDALGWLTLDPGSDLAAGLQAWDWIDLNDKEPWLCSLFGHVFFESSSGVWRLDPIDGSFELRWANTIDFLGDLRSELSQDEHLLAGLAIAAMNRGPQLANRQIWMFVPPPIIGGAITVEHLVAMDIEVGLHVAGQLHSQIRELPPGTRVSRFVFDQRSY